MVHYVTKVWSDVPPGLARATTARRRSNGYYSTIRLANARSNAPAQTLACVTGPGTLLALRAAAGKSGWTAIRG